MIPQIEFTTGALPDSGTVAVLVPDSKDLPSLAPAADVLKRAMAAAGWSAAFGKTLDVLVPDGTAFDRIILIGTGKPEAQEADRYARLGGALRAVTNKADAISVLLTQASCDEAADFAMGLQLAAYNFDRYKTVTKDKSENSNAQAHVRLHVTDEAGVNNAWMRAQALGEGMMVARDLVNEPANVLTPKNFANRLKKLRELGCKVTILDGGDMADLKMGALLGVARGSRNAPRMVIMEWNGGKNGEAPVAFVGKGVTFDTGGISIKPSASMEDMKGDMGGAAAVAGLMHALCARKAKANVVGCVALVENMPDGDAQRPGDIVTSMSGQTIEIINTDAEGRLVLADALWHINKSYKPKAMVNLATLTGAILVALGNDHAGLFSNNDAVAEQLSAAGMATNEKVWRLPLGKAYDKLIDTKNADMKNTGGRMAGSITAAQFLQRFVENTPWAHLDVAGTAMGSPKTEISTGWASGFGVRLLDRYVADNFEV